MTGATTACQRKTVLEIHKSLLAARTLECEQCVLHVLASCRSNTFSCATRASSARMASCFCVSISPARRSSCSLPRASKKALVAGPSAWQPLRAGMAQRGSPAQACRRDMSLRHCAAPRATDAVWPGSARDGRSTTQSGKGHAARQRRRQAARTPRHPTETADRCRGCTHELGPAPGPACQPRFAVVALAQVQTRQRRGARGRQRAWVGARAHVATARGGPTPSVHLAQ